MKNPCKSYTLNIMSLISLLCFIYWGKDLIMMYIDPHGGDGDIIAFIYIPASLIFIIWLIAGILIEHAFYKSNQKYFAFNFPYEKIPFKIIYYALFYLGLVYGSFWGVDTLIALPLMLLFT